MNRRKVVEDLVSTFEDGSVLHAAYKGKMKEIILIALESFLGELKKKQPGEKVNLTKWVDSFVESHFKSRNYEEFQ